MKAIYKGVAVACLHLMIVAGVGGKFLYDRAHRPRVWVKTGSVDPDLPIRGRYMALRLEVKAPWLKQKKDPSSTWVALAVENGALVARESDVDTGLVVRTPAVNPSIRNQQLNHPTTSAPDVVFLDDSVLFFLPEHVDFPRLKQGDELWAEVTVPKKGPPRPIQLALKHGTEWKPLSYR
jgi:hypothetical protein